MTEVLATDSLAGSVHEPWRESWFPVAFVTDLAAEELHRITVFDRGYVVFRGADGELACLRDRCPHRAARLSDGRLRDGRVECLYHGWRFDANGACVEIPQLPADTAIPMTACVTPIPIVERQGMAWMWGGAVTETAPDQSAIPAVDLVDRPDCRCIDFAMDLPYGQDYLVENIIDLAHIHVAHDGVRGGGHRHLAGPVEFEISDPGPDGFHADFGNRGGSGDSEANGNSLVSARVEFVAPNLIHYRSIYESEDRYSGLALYSVPLEHGRCRLLYRTYSNFWPLRDRLRPRFLEHFHQCHLLEQDMAVVMGQADAIRRSHTTPDAMWLPLKTSDSLVLAYRGWLDTFAADRPDYIGFRGRGDESSRAWQPGPIDRLTLHTQQCSSCSRALRRVRMAKTILPLLAFALLALACAIDSRGWAFYNLLFAAVLIQAGALVAKQLCRQLTLSPIDPLR